MNDKYIYETEDKNKITLVNNIEKFSLLLHELKQWRRDLYKSNNIEEKMFLIKGEWYKGLELESFTPDNKIGVVSEKDIINKIEVLLDKYGKIDLTELEGEN